MLAKFHKVAIHHRCSSGYVRIYKQQSRIDRFGCFKSLSTLTHHQNIPDDAQQYMSPGMIKF